jgi:hypothetical protein
MPTAVGTTPIQPAPASDAATIKTAMRIDNIIDSEVKPKERKDSKVEDEPAAAAHSATPSTMRETPADEPTPMDVSGPEEPCGKEHREFICMNDEFSECRTGQYTLNLSRKIISNHFGRNKACTRLIKDWPLFCRKHYQRATYKPALWQKRKVNLILRQFDIIEETLPGTTYEVSLKKSEMDRINTFARSTDAGMSAQEAGALVAPNPDVKAFQAPIDVLRELHHWIGKNKSLKHVKEVLSVINTMIDSGECAEVPSIEFLPEIPSARSSKPKAAKAAKPSKPAGRVNKKGAIQKPNAS